MTDAVSAEEFRIPVPYVAIFYDTNGEVQLGGEGNMSLNEVELMMEIGLRKAKLIHLKEMQNRSSNTPSNLLIPR